MSKLKAGPGEPRYRQLEKAIIARLRDGSLSPGERLESPEELAKVLDGSASTVRLALQNLASQGILIRVPRRGTMVSQDALRMLQPENTIEPSVNGKNFGLLVPDIRIHEYASIAGAILEVTHATGTNVTVFSTEDDRERYDSSIRRCLESRFNGLVIVPPLYTPLRLETLTILEQAKVPVVTVWRPIDVMGWPVVRSDPTDGLFQTTSHLVSMRCKHIAMMSFQAPEHDLTRMASILGYERALAAGQLQFNPDNVFTAPNITTLSRHMTGREQSMFDELVEWLRQRPEIDGIASQHDLLAGMAVKALAKLGRPVPGDVMVTGVGGYHAISAWLGGQSLATYDLDYNEFGRRICSILDRIAEGHVFPRGHHEVVKGRFVPGDSATRTA